MLRQSLITLLAGTEFLRLWDLYGGKSLSDNRSSHVHIQYCRGTLNKASANAVTNIAYGVTKWAKANADLVCCIQSVARAAGYRLTVMRSSNTDGEVQASGSGIRARQRGPRDGRLTVATGTTRQVSTRDCRWPAAQCEVIHQLHGTIVSDLILACRTICTSPMLKKYYVSRFEWGPEVWDLVAMDDAGRCLRYYDYNDRVRLIKMRTGWLSVNARASHYISGRSADCPSCSTKEDMDHFFRCKASERCDKWLQAVVGHLESGTNNAGAGSVFSQGLAQWHGGSVISPPDQCAEGVRSAFHAQTTIGWHLAGRGFLAKEWARCASTTGEGDKWIAAVHRAIFDAFLKLWSARNEAMHGTPSIQTAREEADTKAKIRAAYEQSRKILPSDARWIFTIPEERLLSKPKAFQKQWLRMSQQVLPGAIQRARELPRGQRLITGFLPPRTGLADDPP